MLKDESVYLLWVPSEEKLEEMVVEHAKEIFGDSEYFEKKTKIESAAGVASIPDGYLVKLSPDPSWFVVEVELSRHDLDDHIGKQILKFTRGIKNPESRNKIVDKICGELDKDPLRYQRFKERIADAETHRFLSTLTKKEPTLLIVIEEKTKGLEELCEELPLDYIVLEFKTYVKEGEKTDNHLHLIEPLSEKTLTLATELMEEGPSDVIGAKLGGKTVTISRDSILKAIEDPKIENYAYRDWYVEFKRKRLPVKGLISLATGIPTTEFQSQQVRPLLKRLGFEVKKVTEGE